MLVPALFTGCIKEDMDDCMNVAVCFQYNADGQDNVLQNYIHDINLYTFTTNGSIHSRIPVGKEYLTNEKRFKQIQLPAGNYSLVAVANAYDKTEVKTGGSSLEQIFIQHPQWQNSAALSGQDHNYLGRCDLQIPDYHTLQEVTIQLFSAHIDAYVEVHGLQPPVRSGEATAPAYRHFHFQCQCANQSAESGSARTVDYRGTGFTLRFGYTDLSDNRYGTFPHG